MNNNSNINKGVYKNLNKNNSKDDNSDLSELADEFIEAFNIDIDNDEENNNILKRAKSSNLQNNQINNKKDNNVYVSSFQYNKSRTKDIVLNDAKNRTKVSPRFAGNKRQNEVEKEIKPFKETIQLDESLIHDFELFHT